MYDCGWIAVGLVRVYLCLLADKLWLFDIDKLTKYFWIQYTYSKKINIAQRDCGFACHACILIGISKDEEKYLL